MFDMVKYISRKARFFYSMNITRLTFDQYPYLLRQIQNPPEFLDCAGALPPSDDHKFLCVIGAREHSEYGANACRHLIAGLKDYPIVIVSGLALGIDSIAHRAALDNKMKTISFPGSGLDRRVIYPSSHWGLAERIVDSGNTLLSPFEIMQEGAHWTFPARNRLMAGISHATLIIEGRQKSGTLLTAEYALQFNRDVLIVPGSIFEELSYGPHLLYKQGATPVTTSAEILAALGFDIPDPDSAPKQLAMTGLNLCKEESAIIRALQFSPLSSSALIDKVALNASEANIFISQLELQGLIIQEGNVYKIKSNL